MKKLLFLLFAIPLLCGAQNSGIFSPLPQWDYEEEAEIFWRITDLNDSVSRLDVTGSDLIATGLADSVFSSYFFIAVIPDSVLSGYEMFDNDAIWGVAYVDGPSGSFSPLIVLHKGNKTISFEAFEGSPVADETEFSFVANILLKKNPTQMRVGYLPPPRIIPQSLARITQYQNRVVAYCPQVATIQVIRLNDGFIEYSHLFTGTFSIDFQSLKTGYYSALVIESSGAKTQKKFTVR